MAATETTDLTALAAEVARLRFALDGVQANLEEGAEIIGELRIALAEARQLMDGLGRENGVLRDTKAAVEAEHERLRRRFAEVWARVAAALEGPPADAP